MMKENRVAYATQRCAEDEIHIECRMRDGQKGAFIIIDARFPELADEIVVYLNFAAEIDSSEISKYDRAYSEAKSLVDSWLA